MARKWVGSTPSASSDLATRGSILRSALIDTLTWGEAGRAMIAHRNGPRVYPEMSYEGMDACAQAGFHLETDVLPLADGTLVCNHDGTVDRTMINIGTGDVSTKTVKQWRQARIKPAITGGRTGTPMFFDEVLDRYGGRHLLVPQLKVSASVTPFIEAIKSRKLERHVLAQSTDYTICQTIAAAGIEVLFVSANPPADAAAAAAIKAAGVNFIGGSYSAASWTTVAVTMCKTAGLKCIAWTLADIADTATAWAKGFDALMSDDPWMSAGQLPLTANVDLTENPPPGTRVLEGGAAVFTAPVRMAAGGIGVVETAATAVTRVVNLPIVGKLNRPFKVEYDVLFDSLAAGQTAGLGFSVWNNTSDPNAEWGDTAVTGQNGFTFVVRRNGIFQAWHYTNGAAAVSLGTAQAQWYGSGATLANTEFAAAGKTGFVRCAVVFTATTIEVHAASSATDIAASASFSTSLNPVDMKFCLRQNTTGLFRNISVTQL